MSIYSSLYIGLSGMRTNESAIGVVGDNLANVNTVGFKASRAVFNDVLNRTIIGAAGPSQAGQGAALASIQRMVTQGAFLGTNVTTDLAIGGDGYLVVRDPATDGQMYTRNGQLQIGEDGFLTTVNGMRLQGYGADATGALSTRIDDLSIGDLTSPPHATSGVNMSVNLDPSADIDDLTATPFDPTDPTASSSFSSSVTVYDSLGNAHQIDAYFSRTGTGEWTWNAVAAGDELDGGVAGTPQVVASGTLSFNGDGTLQTETQGASSVTFADGAQAQELLLDFGEAIDAGGSGEGSTSFAGGSALSSVDQDGYGVGSLQYIDIAPDGTIQGSFSNAETRVLGQIALARFEAPQALNAEGGTMFSQTPGSGDPAIGAANTGGRGQIYSGALEQSNVDMTTEFTQLIVAQRGFQAASRTITTADEMLMEVVNLKR